MTGVGTLSMGPFIVHMHKQSVWCFRIMVNKNVAHTGFSHIVLIWIIDWAMQEVIRLELCSVTRACGGMVSQRVLGMLWCCTGWAAARAMPVGVCLKGVLGLTGQYWRWFPALWRLSSCCGMFQFLSESTQSPTCATTVSLAFSMRESKDLTRHDQYLASHAWNRQMFGVSFSETGGFCWVKGINAAFRLRVWTSGFWGVCDAIPAHTWALEICVAPRPLLAC